MEEKEVVEQKIEQPKAEKEIKMTEKFLYLLFALASIVLTVLTVVLVIFGVYHNVVHGIVILVACALPVVGSILTYAIQKKPTFELYANMFALALALLSLKIW